MLKQSLFCLAAMHVYVYGMQTHCCDVHDGIQPCVGAMGELPHWISLAGWGHRSVMSVPVVEVGVVQWFVIWHLTAIKMLATVTSRLKCKVLVCARQIHLTSSSGLCSHKSFLAIIAEMSWVQICLIGKQF